MSEDITPQTTKNLSRKKFLKRMSLGTLALLSSGIVYFQFWAYESPPPEFKNLGSMEYSLVKQLGQLFFPENNAIGVSANDINVTARIDEQFSLLPPELNDQMHLLLLAVELSTVASRYLRPFSHLSQEQQIKVLKSWERSSIGLYRLLLKGSKLLFSLVYFSHEKVKAALDYAPKCAGLA